VASPVLDPVAPRGGSGVKVPTDDYGNASLGGSDAIPEPLKQIAEVLKWLVGRGVAAIYLHSIEASGDKFLITNNVRNGHSIARDVDGSPACT